jgi:hypothetical protein
MDVGTKSFLAPYVPRRHPGSLRLWGQAEAEVVRLTNQ